MKIEITNDFGKSECQFVIELKKITPGLPYTKLVNRYSFDHPMQFLKAMTDGLVDEIEKAGLNALGHYAAVEKAQREEPVDLEEEFKTHLALTPIGRAELRTKALELAILSYGESIKTATSLGILTFAKTFYTYITKGE